MISKPALFSLGAILALVALNPSSNGDNPLFPDIGTAHAAGNGAGHGKGNGHGNGVGGGNGIGQGNSVGSNHGALASARGNLNAAHASKQGLANASPNSVVGMLRGYMAAVASDDPDARGLLDTIANKGPVSDETANSVDGLLGIEGSR